MQSSYKTALNNTQLNTEQIQEILSLKYSNGKPIIDPNHPDILIEILGMLHKYDGKSVIDFLKRAPNADYIYWEQPSMEEGKAHVAREIEIYQTKEVGVKGVGTCHHCKSNELVYATKQLRSADEASTIFVRCVTCNKQWSQ